MNKEIEGIFGEGWEEEGNESMINSEIFNEIADLYDKLSEKFRRLAEM